MRRSIYTAASFGWCRSKNIHKKRQDSSFPSRMLHRKETIRVIHLLSCKRYVWSEYTGAVNVVYLSYIRNLQSVGLVKVNMWRTHIKHVRLIRPTHTLTLWSIIPCTDKVRQTEADWREALLDLVLRICSEVWIMVEPLFKPAFVLLLFLLHGCLAQHGTSTRLHARFFTGVVVLEEVYKYFLPVKSWRQSWLVV